MSTSGCSASGLPAFSPKPGTTLKTPSGIPASLASLPRQRAPSGDCSAGLSITELPATSAGPIFQAAMMSG